ncbi:MAG: hypothetical protein CFE24_11440 [Flavobacterium sp. BFFFF2]|nr:MAG: hypothetical protein CFE24_11440 [Flavobacterium sp. BFFFF2]
MLLEFFSRPYVVDQIGDAAGFASMPPAYGAQTDAIFIQRSYLRNDTQIVNNMTVIDRNMNVLAHEMGHYLGLYHIFGICDPSIIANYPACSCNNNDPLYDGDMVQDTPPSMKNMDNTDCLQQFDTCPSAGFDDKANYMDYGNWDCEYHFTLGQIDRMRYMVDPVYGVRKDLLRNNCDNCSAFNNCLLKINDPLVNSTVNDSKTIIQIGNVIPQSSFNASLLCGANTSTPSINYNWTLTLLSNISTSYPNGNSSTYTLDPTLPVGNYELKLIVSLISNSNCRQSSTYKFAIIPQPGNCNFVPPSSSTNWDINIDGTTYSWKRVDYTEKWPEIDNSIHNEQTLNATDYNSNFEVINTSSINVINDANFTNFSIPNALSRVVRIGNVSAEDHKSRGHFLSVKIPISRNNCKYRIYILGKNESSSRCSYKNSGINEPNTPSGFGFVCNYDYKNTINGPANPVQSVILGQTMYGLGWNNWWPQNDWVSHTHNDEASYDQTYKMTSWTHKDVDFSEFVNDDSTNPQLTTYVTITFFSHDSSTFPSNDHAYAYFGIECLGGGIPENYDFSLENLNIDCENKNANANCTKNIIIDAPKYVNDIISGWLTNNSNSIHPYGKIRIFKRSNENAQFNEISNPFIGLDSYGESYTSFCLNADETPYVDYKFIVTTWHKEVTKVMRVFNNYHYDSTPPVGCTANLPFYGGTYAGDSIANHDHYICGSPVTKLLELDPPCFCGRTGLPDCNYQWFVQFGPLEIPIASATQQNFLATSNVGDPCLLIYRRKAVYKDPYCGSKIKYPSQSFNIYRFDAITPKFDDDDHVDNSCLVTGRAMPINATIHNLRISTNDFCLPDQVIDSVSLELCKLDLASVATNPTYQSLGCAPQLFTNIALNPNLSAFLINQTMSFNFDNNLNGTPFFDIGSDYYLYLKANIIIRGCAFVKYIKFHNPFNVKQGAIGGSIITAGCSPNSIQSNSNGTTSQLGYIWEFSLTTSFSSLLTTTIPLPATAFINNLNQYTNESHYYVRRKSLGSDQCTVPDYSNIVYVSSSPIQPTFSLPTSICAGTPLVLPTTSNNYVTGTWSPAFVPNTSRQYTFTPASGQCAVPYVYSLTATPNVVPDFSLAATYCSNDALPTLKLVSTNNIAGTWSPTTISNSQSQDYVFTPNSGQCAPPVTKHITIIPATVPLFGQLRTHYCLNDPTIILPTFDENGVAGSWTCNNLPITTIPTNQPATFNCVFQVTGGNACSTYQAVFTISLNYTSPQFSFPTSICPGVTAPILPTVSNNNIHGIWSPSNVSNTVSSTYVFTPDPLQCAILTSAQILVLPSCEVSIGWNGEVSCEDLSVKDHSNIVDGPCIRVCENSNVTYTLSGGVDSSTTTVWHITGGYIVAAPTNTSCEIHWTNAANAAIQATITLISGTEIPFHRCVEIVPAPHAGFGVYPNLAEEEYTVCINSPVAFTNTTTNNNGNQVMHYNWNFGDLNTTTVDSTQDNPTHTYTTVGDYSVHLTAFNGCSCFDTHDVVVHVINKTIPISCPGVLCEGETATYSIPEAVSADCSNSIVWEAVGGQVVDQNTTHTSATIQWNAPDDSGFGHIIVHTNNCYNCTSAINVPIVKQNGSIQGENAICTKSESIYSLPQWPATQFTWSLSNNTAGAVLTPVNQGNQAAITASTAGYFDMYCNYTNTLLNCTGTAHLHVVVKPSLVLNGPTSVCSNEVNNYTLQNTSSSNTNAIAWILTGPYGYSNTSTDTSFPLTFSAAGTYVFSTQSTDVCSNGLPAIHVKSIAAAPVAITGPTIVCPGTPETYTCALVQGYTTHWEIVNSNGTFIGSAVGSSVTVNFDPTSNVPYVLKVWYQKDGCSSDSFTQTIDRLIPDMTLLNSPLSTVCGSSTQTYQIADTAAESYIWTISPASAGSITEGQNTHQINVLWNQPAVGTTTQAYVKLTVRKCGLDYTFNYPNPNNGFPVTVITTPVATIVTPTASTVCSEVPIPFSFTLNPQFSYTTATWDFGDGITTSQSDTVTHSFRNPLTAQVNSYITLTVSGISGCAVNAVATRQITVSPTPVITSNPSIVSITPDYVPLNHVFHVIIQNGFGNSASIYWYNVNPPSAPIYPQQFSLDATQVVAGAYQAMVTNSFGCSKHTTSMLINGPGGSPGGQECSLPDDLYHITPSVSGCGQFTASADLSGAPNITAANWSVESGSTYTSNQSGLNSMSATMTQPGSYSLKLDTIENVNGAPCKRTSRGVVVIPYIADMRYKVTCNNNSGTYKVTVLDHSVYFPNTPISSFEFTKDGGNSWQPFTVTGSPNDAQMVYDNLAPGPYTFGVRISGPGNPDCQKTISVVLPSMPTVTVSSLETVACAGTPVHFMANSTGTNVTYWWTFEPLAYNALQNPARTFSTGGDPYVSVLVTDQNGCTATGGTVVHINKENMQGNVTAAPTMACKGGTIVLNYNVTSVSTPTHYHWYNSNAPTTELATTTPPNTAFSVSNSGQYFVYTEDSNNCMNFRNAAVTAAFIPSPAAPLLSGGSSVCAGTTLELSVPADTTVQYQWSVNNVVQAASTPNHIFDLAQSIPGTYTIEVTAKVSDGAGGFCAGPPATQPIQVLATPAQPIITLAAFQCVPYAATLNVTNPQVGVSYYWSNGDTGTLTHSTHEGPLEVRAETFGCSSVAQRELPIDLQTLSWVFPNGCYDACSNASLSLTGPVGNFTQWTWFNENENLQSGSGPVAPLNNVTPLHQYHLQLQTPECTTNLTVLDLQDAQCIASDFKATIDPVLCIQTPSGDIAYQLHLHFLSEHEATFAARFSINGLLGGHFEQSSVTVPYGTSDYFVLYYPPVGFQGDQDYTLTIRAQDSVHTYLKEITKVRFPELCEFITECKVDYVVDSIFCVPTPSGFAYKVRLGTTNGYADSVVANVLTPASQGHFTTSPIYIPNIPIDRILTFEPATGFTGGTVQLLFNAVTPYGVCLKELYLDFPATCAAHESPNSCDFDVVVSSNHVVRTTRSNAYMVTFQFENNGDPIFVYLAANDHEGSFDPSLVLLPSGSSTQSLLFSPQNGFQGGDVAISLFGYGANGSCSKQLTTRFPVFQHTLENCGFNAAFTATSVEMTADGQFVYQLNFSCNTSWNQPVTISLAASSLYGSFMPTEFVVDPSTTTTPLSFVANESFHGGGVPVNITVDGGNTELGQCATRGIVYLPAPYQMPSNPTKTSSTVFAGHSLRVAPNPAQNSTTLYYEYGHTATTRSISIVDLLGRTLATWYPTSAQGALTIDCATYGSSTYLVLMKENDQIIEQTKLIITH